MIIQINPCSIRCTFNAPLACWGGRQSYRNAVSVASHRSAFARHAVPCRTRQHRPHNNLSFRCLTKSAKRWRKRPLNAVKEAAPTETTAPSFATLPRDVEQRFASLTEWIVFSDLHVHQRHSPHWREALDSVRSAAEERQAGCIFLFKATLSCSWYTRNTNTGTLSQLFAFLGAAPSSKTCPDRFLNKGDFWDSRDQVSHELLEEVRGALRGWQRPTLCITGNHDQLSRCGHRHTLGIVADIAPSWNIIDEPTLALGAAWIPYQAEQDLTNSLLEQAGKLPITALFCHADIKGASYNNVQQAFKGISPKSFPTQVPSYTGHYHKPHDVPGSRITYIGSPFQLGFGEAHQAKRMLLLDNTFQLLQSLPLQCGRQHHNLVWSEGTLMHAATDAAAAKSAVATSPQSIPKPLMSTVAASSGGDIQASRSFLWGPQTTLTQTELQAASDLDLNGSKSAATHSANGSDNGTSSKSTHLTEATAQEPKHIQISSKNGTSIGPAAPDQASEGGVAVVVSAEAFGKRDTIRITAAVAGQAEVDDVAKTIRKSGAKVQVQLEQPQRDRLSEIPTAAPLTPTDTLQEFFQYRGLRSASDTQPPAASTSASDSETETTCLSSIDSADESAVGVAREAQSASQRFDEQVQRRAFEILEHCTHKSSTDANPNSTGAVDTPEASNATPSRHTGNGARDITLDESSDERIHAQDALSSADESECVGEASGSMHVQPMASVELHDVEVEGFRCFGKQRVKLSFSDMPGLVAVTGRNEIDNKSEVGQGSNGAGKTALASAAVWALTGKLSMFQGVTTKKGMVSSDAINISPDVKRAIVTLRGRLGGELFEVTRTRTASKNHLEFTLGGTNLTAATYSLTQEVLERHLPAMLAAVLFHSDASITSLLEASDAKFKDTLATLVDLNIWQDCYEEAREHERAAVARRTAATASATQRRTDADSARTKHSHALSAHSAAATAAQQAQRAASEASSQVEAIEGRARETQLRIQGCLNTISNDLVLMRQRCSEASSDVESTRAVTDGETQEGERLAQESKIAAASSALREARSRLFQLQTKLSSQRNILRDSLQPAVLSAQQALEEVDRRAEGAPILCQACGQPLPASSGEAHATLLSTRQAALSAALDAKQAAKSKLTVLAAEVQEAAEAEYAAETHCFHVQEEIRQHAVQANMQRSRQHEHALQRLAHLQDKAGALERLQQRLSDTSLHLTARLGAAPASDDSLELAEDPVGIDSGTAEGLLVDEESVNECLDAREAEVASTCGAVHERLQAITAAEQTLQAQNTACMHSEAEARSKQEAARREEDDVRLYTKEMEEAERSAASAQQEEHVCSALKNVFGAKGVQHFVLDGVVHDLSTYTRNYLKTLLPAFQLDLHMTQPEEASKKKKKRRSEQDQILKRLTRVADGNVAAQNMDVGCLSRGEARRVGLALTLGYNKLLEARGVCMVDTLILDEPHTNLDSEGVRAMMSTLRTLGKRSVLVIAQAGSEVEGRADHRVAVVKKAATDVVLEQF